MSHQCGCGVTEGVQGWHTMLRLSSWIPRMKALRLLRSYTLTPLVLALLCLVLVRSQDDATAPGDDPFEMGDAVPFPPPQVQESGTSTTISSDQDLGDGERVYECLMEAPCQLEIGKVFGDPFVKTNAGDVKYFQVRRERNPLNSGISRKMNNAIFLYFGCCDMCWSNQHLLCLESCGGKQERRALAQEVYCFQRNTLFVVIWVAEITTQSMIPVPECCFALYTDFHIKIFNAANGYLVTESNVLWRWCQLIVLVQYSMFKAKKQPSRVLYNSSTFKLPVTEYLHSSAQCTPLHSAQMLHHTSLVLDSKGRTAQVGSTSSHVRYTSRTNIRRAGCVTFWFVSRPPNLDCGPLLKPCLG